jgi:hypothetical protein
MTYLAMNDHPQLSLTQRVPRTAGRWTSCTATVRGRPRIGRVIID